MWIGLLTAGAHPARPAANAHLATLFAWGPRTRARVDGPQAALPDGIRALRRSAPDEVGTLCRPRCFTCREPYPLPDPLEIRAQQDAADLGDPDATDGPDDPGADAEARRLAGGRTPAPGAAVFALVHIADEAPEGDEGEALVLVPSTMLALLVPFDALGIFSGLVADAFGALALPECGVCASAVPGGTLGEPNRAARRRAAKGRRRHDPGEGARAA